MSSLKSILATYRAQSQTEREKGSYFEELIRTYFRNEPRFADLYSDWAKEIGGPQFGLSAKGKVVTGLQSADRGKLIMACGTGKTFTSLKIAEDVAGKDKRVLFLVPSLKLLSQTLTEWTQESAIPLHSFAVCSDVEVGKKRNKDEDIVETLAHELRYPATTDAKRVVGQVKLASQNQNKVSKSQRNDECHSYLLAQDAFDRPREEKIVEVDEKRQQFPTNHYRVTPRRSLA